MSSRPCFETVLCWWAPLPLHFLLASPADGGIARTISAAAAAPRMATDRAQPFRPPTYLLTHAWPRGPRAGSPRAPGRPRWLDICQLGGPNGSWRAPRGPSPQARGPEGPPTGPPKLAGS